ncbi:hypothetical protein L3X38_042219 [Prunus dulcis]|uniref:Uncharacterized protein n=1 Tax=Prunus dulcis TaxID=3755 RepID=A0AAD4YL45_PRUDU|nr:hypothetical protein L3X38_042219 [Prunus dulcis]
MAYSASGSFSGQAPLASSSCRFNKLPKEFRVKLPAIIDDDCIGKTESAANVSPDEVFHPGCHYGYESFGLHPFVEIVHSNHDIVDLAFPLALDRSSLVPIKRKTMGLRSVLQARQGCEVCCRRVDNFRTSLLVYLRPGA